MDFLALFAGEKKTSLTESRIFFIQGGIGFMNIRGFLSSVVFHRRAPAGWRRAAAVVCATVTLLAAPSTVVFGMEILPFQTTNQSPLVRIFGLPAIGAASVLPAGRVEGTFSVDASNNFAPGFDDGESVMLDGETYRFALAARYGIAPGFEIGLSIPLLANSGGFMDGFIEGFHDFFGFSQGDRKSYPRDRLQYEYTRAGDRKVLVDDGSIGIGDIRLSGAWRLYDDGRENPRQVALHGSVKLPTGNSHRLFGSGSTDFALWVTASDDYRLPLGNLTLYAAGGGLVMTDGDVLRDQQRNLVGFGSLGIGWSPLEWLALKIQADGHTSFYSGSNLVQVNSGSVQLTTGGTFGITRNTFLDVGISEDVVVDASPDVVFHLALRSRF
jgi:hypothetical protein